MAYDYSNKQNKFTRIISVVLLLFLLQARLAHTKETYGDFPSARYIKNYDGDTVTFNLPGLHPIIGDNISVRIYGIDTPELRGKCQQEKDLARQAKRMVASLLKNAKNINLEALQRGKYFRIVGGIKADGLDIGGILIKNGLAVQYFGGKKMKKWCK